MERMVAATSRVLQRDAAWSNDLVAHALRRVLPLLRQPREAAETLRAAACAEIERQRSFTVVFGMVERQAELRDRLIDLGLFWMRLAAAWASVHPETTDRREIEVLCRNLLRRLQLKSLYMPP
jgi:hypothetical protein